LGENSELGEFEVSVQILTKVHAWTWMLEIDAWFASAAFTEMGPGMPELWRAMRLRQAKADSTPY
jgi:hypothetical protein